jgi:serine/threonine protein kinase
MKVQTTKPPRRVKNRYVFLPHTLGGGTAAFVLFAIVFAIIRWRRNEDESDKDEFGEVPGMPTKFSFQSLKVATKDFSSKIGEGGFGSVFKGELGDELVAVKHLHPASQGTKDFLAEIQTIGNLHHINLVRLIGFCTEKLHMLLVYEYMSRGSLDRWIYYADNKARLDWRTRRKIITDIAKGLSYLHEDCRQRIAHLDIKPQNILLDDNFDAKVADFGLSKLIDRDQSRVVTRMRGTPGYMAPEWLTSQITEKVDVYSFGVVVIEIICGRKNIDYSQPESSIQLISLLQEKAKNGKLEDLIERNSLDTLMHKEEVVEMMKLAIWCLQSDAGRTVEGLPCHWW